MTPVRTLSLGLLLTATAGYIDAVGFISLGGYYTSFMSGNTTQLGIGAVTGLGWALALPASLVSLFFIGSFVGTLAARWGGAAALGIVIAAVATTLLLHAGGFAVPLAMLPLALAAGAQNAALRSAGAVRLGATFVTGTLFAAGQDLAKAVLREAPRWRWIQHLLVWIALCAGALAGGWVYGQWHVEALFVPGAIYLATLLGLLMRRV